jgi:hypothetical protein
LMFNSAGTAIFQAITRSILTLIGIMLLKGINK